MFGGESVFFSEFAVAIGFFVDHARARSPIFTILLINNKSFLSAYLCFVCFIMICILHSRVHSAIFFHGVPRTDGELELGVHLVDVLLHVASLVEAHATKAHGAHEGLLVAVDAEMRIEFGEAAENLVARGAPRRK